MTNWINCSAYHLSTGQAFATKKALIAAVKTAPTSVLLTTTSEFNGPIRQITADMIRAGEAWQVVGPSPNNRKWYATIEVKGNPGVPVAK